MKERLNLQDDDVMRCLHSLSCGKYKILLKSPEGRVINRNDKFQVNMKFKDRMFRIKVPLPPVDERRKVVEDVDKDRRYAIDAAIVRTMKSRKKLQHQQVISKSNSRGLLELQNVFHTFYTLLGNDAWENTCVFCPALLLTLYVCGAQLVLEVNQQLQRMFKPDLKQIKRRIDDLIAREYLERDKANRNEYHYMA